MTGYLIGAAGGLASALLYAALYSGGGLAFPLFMVSPLPIAIVGLGWGTGAGITAAVVSAAAIGGALMPLVGVVFFVMLSAPAALYAYLAGLARPRDDGTLEWYPVHRLLLAIAAVTAITFTVVGIASGYDPAITAAFIEDILREAFATMPEAGATDADIAEVAALYARIMPFAVSVFWVLMMALSVWLAARVVTISGRFSRPPPRLADELALPPLAALVLAIAALGLASDALGLVAGAFAGAFGMAFAIVGFAVVHVRSRGFAARGVLLTLVYGLTILVSLPLLPLALLGAADSLLNLRARQTPRT